MSVCACVYLIVTIARLWFGAYLFYKRQRKRRQKGCRRLFARLLRQTLGTFFANRKLANIFVEICFIGQLACRHCANNQ